MNVSSVNLNATQAAQTAQTKEPSIVQITAVPEHGRQGDTVEISPRRANQSAMEHGGSERTLNMKSQMLRRMAERIIKEQYAKGNHLFTLFYGDKAVQLDPSLRPEKIEFQSVQDEQRQAAAKASEYFGPAQTSRRILNTAEDIADVASKPDPAVVDAFRSAVKVAFDNVRTTFDGVMPELTQRTYEATMKGFDSWGTSDTASV